jgi:hypothetical protein
VVVLCELEDLDGESVDKQIYVGLSRAKTHAVIVLPPDGGIGPRATRSAAASQRIPVVIALDLDEGVEKVRIIVSSRKSDECAESWTIQNAPSPSAAWLDSPSTHSSRTSRAALTTCSPW